MAMRSPARESAGMHSKLSRPQSSGRSAKDRLLDQAIERYVDWREASAAVRATYAEWCGAPIALRAPWFQAYLAALDEEESAAMRYGTAIKAVGARSA
jgi:hypothetical protein